MKKRLLSLVLAFVLIFGCLPGMSFVEAEEEAKPTKVVVSVEGQTLGQGFYIEPEIVTFDEFIDYWAQKGQTVTPDGVTAGGVLSYALQKNGTPMDYQESVSGPAYLATVKGVDKGYTDLPQFLKDAGVELAEYDGDPNLSEHKYTAGSGWMYTEGNIMSDQAMGGHCFYTLGTPYEQNGESYYVVRLQYTVDGLGADLGFDRSGVSYSYEAADKGQLYILYANLAESGFFDQNPQAKENALAVMNTLNATQNEVDAAYETLLEACHAELPVLDKNLSEEPVYYGIGEEADILEVQASVSVGELTYEWFSSTDKIEWTSLGVGEASYRPTTETSGTTYYKCVVTNYDNVTGLSNEVSSNIATVVTGIETPVFVEDLDKKEVTYLTVDTAEKLRVGAQIAGEGAISYQWYQSTDKASWEKIEGATAQEYEPKTEKIGTTYYKCTAVNTLKDQSVSADSTVAMITVKVDAPAFEQNLMTTTYNPKFDEKFELGVKASVKDKGTVSYQWYEGERLAPDGSIEGMTQIPGATSDTYRIDTSKAGAKYYKVVVTNTLQGETVSAVSKWSRIEMKAETPRFTKDLDGEDIYYLVGEENPKPLEVEAVAEDGGEITYQWYQSEKNPWGIISYMEAIEGATQPSLEIDTTKEHTTYYACQATNTLRGDAQIAESTIVKVVVSCEKPVLTKDLEEKTSYHAGETAEPLEVVAEVSDGGTLSYQWYRSEEQWLWGIDTMESIEGATGSTYMPDLSKSGVKYACRVTNTKDGNSLSTDSQITEVEVIHEVQEPEEAYWGVQTEAKVYDDFENDIWLQYQQKEMQVGDTASLRPWRMEQIISNAITNDVQRPTFHFEIIAGDSISLDTDSSNDKAVVTAEKPGTSVVKVTYDALENEGKTWGAISPVNTAYAVFTVGETGTATITCSEELQNWRHYDTIYYTEGETVPYTFHVSSEDAESIKVTLNGKEIEGTDGTYTANLENRSNIIGILAKDKAGKLKSFYRVVDARFMEVNVENQTTPGKPLRPGDTANISFHGVTMPIYKLSMIYNPVWTSDSVWGKSDAAYLSYKNEKLGSFKGQCKQWDLATNNDFEVTFTEAGAYTFDGSEGIWCEWWGLPLGTDLTVDGSGEPGLGVPALNGWFSKLPSFTVTVEEEPVKTPVGTVTVSVQDMIPTPEGKDWPEARGVMLDSAQVSIYEDDTMLDAIERACVENNIEISFDSNKTYVTGIDGLEQLERGEKSGWFVTLNGWFTDDGAGNFTVANGKFADGDIVTMEYSLDYGNDLTDTTDVTGELKSLGINTGELAPQYSRDVYEYTLTIPKDTTEVSFRPESFNRNNKVTIQSNENTYRPGAMITVEEGTIVNITSVPVSYTTPVEPDAKVTYQVTVKYEDDSQNPDPENPDPENPDPEKPDPQEPEKEEITLTDTQYGVSLTGKELTKDMQLVVSKLTKDDAAVDEIRKAIPSSKGVFALYHVELRQDGKEVALSDTAKLNLPVGKKYNGNTMDVLLYTGGEVKKLSGTVTDGYITVKVTQLGDFGVVTDMAGDGASTTDKLSSADGSGNSQTGTVKTGDSVKIEYLVYLIVACAVVITAVVVVKKKRQGK